MSRFKEDSKTKLLKGGPVLNSNRFFLHVKQYGHCDANGKVVMGISFSQKVVAEPDRPLALIEALIEEIIPMLRYSSKKAMQKDIDYFKRYVKSLKPKVKS
jgi:putative AlgH/UPF0301 family transcriptional regulator